MPAGSDCRVWIFCPGSCDRRLRFAWATPSWPRPRLGQAAESFGSQSRDRSHDLLGADNSAGVVRDVDVESGLHRLIRVIRCRVSHHRDLVAKLSGKANGRFDAGMRYEPDDDELMDPVFLELQIQIGVGEAAGTPMLGCDDLAWLRHELGPDLAAPCAVFESLSVPCRLLYGCNVFPSLVVARTVTTMQGIEDPKLRLPRR